MHTVVVSTFGTELTGTTGTTGGAEETGGTFTDSEGHSWFGGMSLALAIYLSCTFNMKS